MKVTVWDLPSDTVEWVGPFTVTFNGAPIDDAFQLGLVPCPTGVAQWFAPDVESAGKGFWVGAGHKVVPIGDYQIKIKTSTGVVIDQFAKLIMR